MIQITEYLNNKMTFAASRKAKFVDSQKSFREFKDFFVELGDIPGLEIATFTASKDELGSINDIAKNISKDDIKPEDKEDMLKIVNALKETNCYMYKFDEPIYEIRENEPDKIIKYKTYKWFLDYLFDENALDIHRVADCTEYRYLLLGEFDQTEMKKLTKWGFSQFVPHDRFYGWSNNNEWWYCYSSTKNWYIDKNGDVIYPVYVIISFKDLLDNIKYIRREFFELVEE